MGGTDPRNERLIAYDYFSSRWMTFDKIEVECCRSMRRKDRSPSLRRAAPSSRQEDVMNDLDAFDRAVQLARSEVGSQQLLVLAPASLHITGRNRWL